MGMSGMMRQMMGSRAGGVMGGMMGRRAGVDVRSIDQARQSGVSSPAQSAGSPGQASTDQPSQSQAAAGAGSQTGSAGMMMGMGGMGGGGAMMRGAPEARNRILRMGNAQSAARLEADETNPKSKFVFKKLDEPIPMSFANETPLEDILKYIKQATTSKEDPAGIPIYVDPKGLQDAEATLNSTIAVDLDGVPLKTTLRLVLKQLGLAYCVRDGVLIISSVQGINEELQEEISAREAHDEQQRRGLQ
jgi:hypothetical protein